MGVVLRMGGAEMVQHLVSLADREKSLVYALYLGTTSV